MQHKALPRRGTPGMDSGHCGADLTDASAGLHNCGLHVGLTVCPLHGSAAARRGTQFNRVVRSSGALAPRTLCLVRVVFLALRGSQELERQDTRTAVRCRRGGPVAGPRELTFKFVRGARGGGHCSPGQFLQSLQSLQSRLLCGTSGKSVKETTAPGYSQQSGAATCPSVCRERCGANTTQKRVQLRCW